MNLVERGVLSVEHIGGKDDGALRERDGGIELSGSLYGIGRQADALTFAWTQAEGDFDFSARLHALTGMQDPGEGEMAAAVAGLAFRESLSPEAANASLLVLPTGRVRLQCRHASGEGTRVIGEPYGAISFPMWLKLERRGPSVHAWASEDGLRWAHFASTEVDLPRRCHAGLLVLGSIHGDRGRATFSDVDVDELPSG